VPLSTAQERLYNTRSRRPGQPLVDLILIEAVTSDDVEDVLIDASTALRQLHNITFRDEDDFLALTQQDFLSAFGAVTSVLTLFLGAIASISLLVGGIGIMNIMLVSVTERTREIGLRKAVGARRRDILTQFLTEAVVLSVSAGVMGILFGWAGAWPCGWRCQTSTRLSRPTRPAGGGLFRRRRPLFRDLSGVTSGGAAPHRSAALRIAPLSG
jgi:putative ABC transport system permease protein